MKRSKVTDYAALTYVLQLIKKKPLQFYFQGVSKPFKTNGKLCTIKAGWSIVYIEGSQVIISKK